MRGQSYATRGSAVNRLSTMLRDLNDRVSRLEKRKVSSLTIGNWKLTTNATGELVATNTQTGQTTTLAP